MILLLNYSKNVKIKTFGGIFLIILIGIVAFTLIPSGINAYNLIYLFILSMIYGISYTLFIKFSKDESPSIKCLELEHNEVLQYIHFFSWGIIFVIIGGVVSSFSSLLQEDYPSNGINLDLFNHTILIIYL